MNRAVTFFYDDENNTLRAVVQRADGIGEDTVWESTDCTPPAPWPPKPFTDE